MLFTALFTSCEKKSDTVIDPVFSSPLISNPFKDRDTIFTTSSSINISFVTSIKVNENGGSTIKNVYCKVFSPENQNLGQFSLLDNGVTPDAFFGDNVFTANVSITGVQCLYIGNYSIQYFAENNDGILSNQINSGIYVLNTANQPPAISNPNLPDSVVRPSSGSIDLTISVIVTDPDGPCDVNEVYFDAYRPNGLLIGNGRIPMVKTGSNLFSFTNPVLPSNADSSYGYFKYFFRANDRSNALSLVLKDSIKFVRP